MTATAPRVMQATRFAESFMSAGVMVQSLIQGAVHDFVRAYRADKRQVARRYQRVRHISARKLIEMDVAGGLRCVASWNPPTLTLLDVGAHDTVPRYREAWIDPDLRSAAPAPNTFLPDSNASLRLFSRNPSTAFEVFRSELTADWLYDLDADQLAAFTRIVDAFIDGDEDNKQVFFVIGGPGTGKTSILLQLLKAFGDLEIPAGMIVSDAVANYIERSLPINISEFRTGVGPHRKRAALLFDDPGHTLTIKTAARNLQSSSVRLLVVAFDPLQLANALPDADFDSLVKESDAEVIELGICYRQKQNVGLAFQKAAQVLAGSTPFLIDDKIADHRLKHSRLTRLANGVLFANPHGYVDVVDGEPMELLIEQLERINRLPKWRHWPAVLVVVDDGYSGPMIRHDDSCWVTKLSQLEQIKGLEFQHVFTVLTRATFDRLENGFTGSGRRAYNEWRLLRIPFSRAKDSFVTIVTAD